MYSDTGIHGVTLLVDGVATPDGSSVAYGSTLAFSVWTSLAADAPTAGNLTLTIHVVGPDGTTWDFTPTKPANPGEGVQFNVGVIDLSMSGTWKMDFQLSSDVAGTQGVAEVRGWYLIVAPSGLELAPGSYVIRVTTSNLSTSGGQPVQATLATHVEVWWNGMDYQEWTSRNIIAAGGSKVNDFEWSIPAGWIGSSGTLKVSVLDPSGTQLAVASLDFSVK
jgi:hypothetical protein